MTTTPESRLLELYDRVAEAPDAIERLRKFVLDLAVRGKLVEQNPADEPAEELLKRIAAERARLVEAGEIKNSKIHSVASADLPYSIPATWTWATLGAVGDWGAGSTPSRSNSELYGGDIIWLKSGELRDRTDLKTAEETVTEKAVRTCSFRRNKPGDILIAMYGATIGKLAILADEAVTNQAVCGCTPFNGVYNRYLFLFLLAQRSAFQVLSEGGAQPNISKVKIVGTAFPLPPLPEQHRIVAKVEELMALLDRLETTRTQRETTRDRLTTASLTRLTAPDTSKKEFPGHARFALHNLNQLTSRPDQIKVLRQTILNLAVRGKLVEQDPEDEPAEELLKRIDRWRQTATEAKQIKSPRKPLKPISNDDHPYILPGGWSWARLGLLIYIKSGDGLTSSNMREGSIPVYGGNGITGYHDEANTTEPTIVIGRVGYYCGSIHLTPSKAWITDNAFVTKYSQNDIHREFMQLLLVATDLKEQDSATAQPVISGAKIYPIVVGLPPLTEQHRIVAKVDELMALCDKLEAAKTTADTAQARLLEVLLHDSLAQDAYNRNTA